MSPSAGSHVVHHGKQSRVVRSPEKSLWSPCGLSWHRRCSLLVVRHVGVGGSAARWPPPHWGRFGARSRPLVVPVTADEHLQHPTMFRRACSTTVLSSFFFGRSQHRSRIRDAHELSRAGHSTGRMPSIHPSIHQPSSHGRLIDVHLPTAPIQGIIKKALAFSVP